MKHQTTDVTKNEQKLFTYILRSSLENINCNQQIDLCMVKLERIYGKAQEVRGITGPVLQCSRKKTSTTVMLPTTKGITAAFSQYKIHITQNFYIHRHSENPR